VHIAARAGHTDVFELLLDAGGRIDTNNREGKSPSFYAQQYKTLIPLLEKKAPAE
jgi:ankyrin repeat protein